MGHGATSTNELIDYDWLHNKWNFQHAKINKDTYFTLNRWQGNNLISSDHGLPSSGIITANNTKWKIGTYLYFD